MRLFTCVTDSSHVTGSTGTRSIHSTARSSVLALAQLDTVNAIESLRAGHLTTLAWEASLAATLAVDVAAVALVTVACAIAAQAIGVLWTSCRRRDSTREQLVKDEKGIAALLTVICITDKNQNMPLRTSWRLAWFLTIFTAWAEIACSASAGSSAVIAGRAVFAVARGWCS